MPIRLMPGVRAFMPPQGLLLIAAYMPRAMAGPLHRREYRAGDSAEDFAWADAVLVSGMHIQAPQIRDIHRRAKAAGKVMALGGPSVSGVAGNVSGVRLSPCRRARRRHRPADRAPRRERARRRRRRCGSRPRSGLPLRDFPIPAYHLIPLERYLMLHAAILLAAVRIAASSATSRRSTAASRG